MLSRLFRFTLHQEWWCRISLHAMNNCAEIHYKAWLMVSRSFCAMNDGEEMKLDLLRTRNDGIYSTSGVTLKRFILLQVQ
jgi:hypothetical protein